MKTLTDYELLALFIERDIPNPTIEQATEFTGLTWYNVCEKFDRLKALGYGCVIEEDAQRVKGLTITHEGFEFYKLEKYKFELDNVNLQLNKKAIIESKRANLISGLALIISIIAFCYSLFK